MRDQNLSLGGPSEHAQSPSIAWNRELGFSNAQHSAADFEEDGLDLATIWYVAWSYRFWILGAGGIGLALALILSFFQTPLYRSTAVLELNPPTVPILSAQGDSGNMEVPSTDWQFLPTQYGILKSRNLAERVVQDLNLANDKSLGYAELKPEERTEALTNQLAANITITPVGDSRLVELTYTSKVPSEASRIVNGYAEAFMSSTLDRRFEATAKARSFLEQRLASVRIDLDDSERKLVEYAKSNDIIIPSTDGESSSNSLSGSSLTTLNQALAEAQQKRISAEQRYRQAGTITEVAQSTSALRQERAKLEAEYQEKSTYLGKDYPEMVRLRTRIDALQQEIGSETSSASGALYAEYKAALAEENSLQERVQQLSGKVLDLRERSIQYNILNRELDTNRSLYDALLERYNKLGVASGIGTPQASIVDRGKTPGAPFSPNIPRNLVLGLLLGLGLGAAGAFGYHFITDKIRTPEDVRDKLGLPALGLIPKTKRKEDLNEQFKDRKSAISEAYSSLLTTLQFTTNAGMPKALLVTSTRAGEGKSTTSFALASGFAQAGKRVLLVDADMRKPSFILEESSDRGLSRLLVGQGRLQDHVLKTKLENLWLLPSGPVPPNPAQLLNSSLTNQILDLARSEFDLVLVDAPPALGIADTTLLAVACDAILLVIESSKTRRSPAKEVVENLRGSGCTIVGVALTKYASVPGSDGYGYGYGYGYGAENEQNEGLLQARIEPHELNVHLKGDD